MRTTCIFNTFTIKIRPFPSGPSASSNRIFISWSGSASDLVWPTGSPFPCVSFAIWSSFDVSTKHLASNVHFNSSMLVPISTPRTRINSISRISNDNWPPCWWLPRSASFSPPHLRSFTPLISCSRVNEATFIMPFTSTRIFSCISIMPPTFSHSCFPVLVSVSNSCIYFVDTFTARCIPIGTNDRYPIRNRISSIPLNNKKHRSSY